MCRIYLEVANVVVVDVDVADPAEEKVIVTTAMVMLGLVAMTMMVGSYHDEPVVLLGPMAGTRAAQNNDFLCAQQPHVDDNQQ